MPVSGMEVEAGYKLQAYETRLSNSGRIGRGPARVHSEALLQGIRLCPSAVSCPHPSAKPPTNTLSVSELHIAYTFSHVKLCETLCNSLPLTELTKSEHLNYIQPVHVMLDMSECKAQGQFLRTFSLNLITFE